MKDETSSSKQPDPLRAVASYVTRLIEYGAGSPDPEFDNSTIGEIADRIVDIVRAIVIADAHEPPEGAVCIEDECWDKATHLRPSSDVWLTAGGVTSEAGEWVCERHMSR